MKRMLALSLILLMAASAALAGETVTLKNGVAVNPKVAAADESYNDMHDDELYALAQAEGDTIVVYSETSKISKAVEAFLQKYPGLKVEQYTLTPAEIQEKW